MGLTRSVYQIFRLKLETSNLAHRLATGGPNEKKCKIRSKGIVKWSRHLLYEILGPPPYLANGWSKKLQIWQAD